MNVQTFRDLINNAEFSTALVIIAISLAVIAVKLVEKKSDKSHN